MPTPDAGYLGVGLGAAALDGGGALQDHHRRALADEEAVVVLVVRSAGAFGVVVAAAHGAHRDKAGDDDRGHRRLRSTADHHVGVAAADEVVAEPHRVGPAAARERRGRRGALHAELDADVGSSGVGHDLGDGERVDPGGSPIVYGRLGVLHARHAPDPAAQDQADALGFLVELCPRAGVLEGELGGGEAHLGEAVGPRHHLAVHEILWVEVRALGCDPHLEALRVEERDLARTALVREQRAPELLAPNPYRADHPYPSYVSLRASTLHLAP